MNGTVSKLDHEGIAALSHMEQALQLLDICQEATDVGGHLDLAICRLRNILESNGVQVAPRPPQMD